MTQEQNGLDLFDETASAVRGFPNAMLGYDKKAVDDYILDVERQLAAAKHEMREAQRELTAASLRVDDTDYSRLGAHTASLLKVAEAQAADLIQQAQSRADKILQESQDTADRVRREAATVSETARKEGITSLKGLRTDLEAQTAAELEAARTESTALREQADAHHAATIADTAIQVAAMKESALAEIEAQRQQGAEEVATMRAALEQERSSSLTDIATAHAERLEELRASVETNRVAASERLQALETASEELRTRERAAHTQAEDIKASAHTEAGAILDEARATAEERLAQNDIELKSRSDQLKSDITILRQRKQALLTQLAQLSSMATETASEFPEDEQTGPVLQALADLRTPADEAVAAGIDADVADPKLESAETPPASAEEEASPSTKKGRKPHERSRRA
ncbi:MAG: DivIVA domain-containing protein [Propioniciclava sp.]